MARKKPNFRRPGSDLPRNRSKRLGRWMIGLAVTIGVVLVILFIVSRSAGQVTVAENAAGSLLSPVQNLFSSVTKNVRDWFTNRQTVAINRAGGGKIVAVTNEEDITGYTAQVVSPIIADGEAIGAVLLLSKEQGAKMGDAELKVAETAAGIVGRQMEQ